MVLERCSPGPARSAHFSCGQLPFVASLESSSPHAPSLLSLDLFLDLLSPPLPVKVRTRSRAAWSAIQLPKPSSFRLGCVAVALSFAHRVWITSRGSGAKRPSPSPSATSPHNPRLRLPRHLLAIHRARGYKRVTHPSRASSPRDGDLQTLAASHDREIARCPGAGAAGACRRLLSGESCRPEDAQVAPSTASQTPSASSCTPSAPRVRPDFRRGWMHRALSRDHRRAHLSRCAGLFVTAERSTSLTYWESDQSRLLAVRSSFAFLVPLASTAMIQRPEPSNSRIPRTLSHGVMYLPATDRAPPLRRSSRSLEGLSVVLYVDAVGSTTMPTAHRREEKLARPTDFSPKIEWSASLRSRLSIATTSSLPLHDSPVIVLTSRFFFGGLALAVSRAGRPGPGLPPSGSR
ncbi:hypothetical protein C8R47DRAFT_589197 [Mycena vitilis]|nr:hypothetical protein C8R47DRAFT_589197 [Mycena vitilis]